MGWADLDAGFPAMITHNRLFLGSPAGREPLLPLANAVREVVGG